MALILDIPAFVRRAGVIVNRELETKAAADGKRKEKLSVLLLGGSDGERMAVPLDYVRRVEEFAASAKEPMGELTVVQYGDEIVPIVPWRRCWMKGEAPSAPQKARSRRE